MTVKILKFLCCFVCVMNAMVANAAPASKLPKGFIQCKLSDPNVDECVKDALQSGIPHLAKGVPSLNIIQIEPLRIPALEINQGNGRVNINLKFKDLDIINLSTVQINKVHYESTNYSLSFEILAPKPITLDGDYDITGKVLILPIVGKGKCKMDIEVSKVVGVVSMKPVDKKGETYLEIENISWKFIPTKFHIKMDNLFNGDKAMGDNMNVFLNENWRELFDELQPAIEEVFGTVIKGIAQQLLYRVPLNQIILD